MRRLDLQFGQDPDGYGRASFPLYWVICPTTLLGHWLAMV